MGDVRPRLVAVAEAMGTSRRPGVLVQDWRDGMSLLGHGLDRPGVDMRQRMEQLIGLGQRIAQVWEEVRPTGRDWRERLTGALVQGLVVAIRRSGSGLPDDLNSRIAAEVERQFHAARVTDPTPEERQGLWALILALYNDYNPRLELSPPVHVGREHHGHRPVVDKQ